MLRGRQDDDHHLLVSMVTSNAHTSPPDCSHPSDLQASTARDEYLFIVFNGRNKSAGKSQSFNPPAQ